MGSLKNTLDHLYDKLSHTPQLTYAQHASLSEKNHGTNIYLTYLLYFVTYELGLR